MDEKMVEATDEQTLYLKGVEAAARYLESRGYEELEKNWECRFGTVSVIAYDANGDLCFVQVSVHDGIETGLPENDAFKSRDCAERIALAYLMENDGWTNNTEVHFDNISICVIGPHKALLRHHHDCFGMAE